MGDYKRLQKKGTKRTERKEMTNKKEETTGEKVLKLLHCQGA